MAISQDEILSQLENLKNKPRDYLKPKDYKTFMPAAIPNKPKQSDRSIFTAQLQSIMDQSNAATQISDVKAQNARDYKAMLAAQKQLKAAKNALTVAGQPVVLSGGGLKNDSPFNPGAGLMSRQWNGYNLTLNRSVMDNFVGFLNALKKTGYDINSIGTYANRNIAGTNTQSLHALGLAMDINPSANPVAYGKVITNLPKGIGRLASKYGLVWGGNWNGPKYDPMHFSVPYGGRK